MIHHRPTVSTFRPSWRSTRGLSSRFIGNMPMYWMWRLSVCYSDLLSPFSSPSASCHFVSCMWPNDWWYATLIRGHPALTPKSTLVHYPCCSTGQSCTPWVQPGYTQTSKYSWTMLSRKRIQAYTHQPIIIWASFSLSWRQAVYLSYSYAFSFCLSSFAKSWNGSDTSNKR